MQCSSVSDVSSKRIGFTFGFHPNGLYFFYNSNLFGHATLKGDFITFDFDESYNNISSTFILYFDFDSESIKWHARLGHVGQEKLSRLAKVGFLY